MATNRKDTLAEVLAIQAAEKAARRPCPDFLAYLREVADRIPSMTDAELADLREEAWFTADADVC